RAVQKIEANSLELIDLSLIEEVTTDLKLDGTEIRADRLTTVNHVVIRSEQPICLNELEAIHGEYDNENLLKSTSISLPNLRVVTGEVRFIALEVSLPILESCDALQITHLTTFQAPQLTSAKELFLWFKQLNTEDDDDTSDAREMPSVDLTNLQECTNLILYNAHGCIFKSLTQCNSLSLTSSSSLMLEELTNLDSLNASTCQKISLPHLTDVRTNFRLENISDFAAPKLERIDGEMTILTGFTSYESFRQALPKLISIGTNAPVTYDADDLPGGYEYKKDVMTVSSSAKVFVANAEMKQALEEEIRQENLFFGGEIVIVDNPNVG
ncbi:MAG: hypothetical protein ACOCXQ_04070, partial [Patescibacteria group bacterium]